MKLLEARKILRLAGQTKCPVYPGESSYVAVLILQSTVLPYTVPQILHFSLEWTPTLLHTTTPPSPRHTHKMQVLCSRPKSCWAEADLRSLQLAEFHGSVTGEEGEGSPSPSWWPPELWVCRSKEDKHYLGLNPRGRTLLETTTGEDSYAQLLCCKIFIVHQCGKKTKVQ